MLNAEIKASKQRKLEIKQKEIKIALSKRISRAQRAENEREDIKNQEYFRKIALQKQQNAVRNCEWMFVLGIEGMANDDGYNGDDERASNNGMTQNKRSYQRRQSKARKNFLKLSKKLNKFRL